jgi:hypothetical protein
MRSAVMRGELNHNGVAWLRAACIGGVVESADFGVYINGAIEGRYGLWTPVWASTSMAP